MTEKKVWESGGTPTCYRSAMPIRRNHHQVILREKDFVMGVHCSPSILEPPVLLWSDDGSKRYCQAVEIFENVPGSNSFPQTVADIISNWFVRLTYQRPDGSSATFGTSVVGAPSFRSQDSRLHYLPVISRASVRANSWQRLVMSSNGSFGASALVSSTRTYRKPATPHETSMHMNLEFHVTKDLLLNEASSGNDTFRLLTISSMYAGPKRYDGNVITYKGDKSTGIFDLRSRAVAPGYLFPSPLPCTEFELVKTTGSKGRVNEPGSPDSPSMRVRLAACSIPTDELAVQGYLSGASDVNEDSLSIWLEWIACPAVIPEGQVITATFEVTAFPPQYSAGKFRSAASSTQTGRHKSAFCG